ncbi:6-phospho-beta-glucosidase [Haloplasma contractile]|uniref:6-phospho-beta-glucosidase n=1 Tax=Haloplasma contractile SSD-17B TaxID=1033810 RepID=F7PRF0_9MOLU|nr:6-phospho-beta-glucosidase [Haloplasma contractile]ERJ11724.1 6-phospho-beta-glucosidase protein [Haloplasma contractile SSD-17B]
MDKGLKIVTIGGGSSYTPELIEGFIKRYNELPVKEIWLVDVEEGTEKLEIVGNLAKRMIKRASVPIKVITTLDRKAALKNADFVTTQFRVGQLAARELDENIPAKYGMLGQETNGAGGLFKALRTIPVVFDLINDMSDLCKNAWLINFTNPAGIITEAVARHTEFKKFIGVCNVPINMTKHFASLLKVDEEALRVDFGGLNHMSYAIRAYIDEKPCLDQIVNCIKESQLTMKNIDTLSFSSHFIESLSVIPSPYHKYYYLNKEMLDKSLEQAADGKTRASIVKGVEEKLFEQYKNVNLNEKPKELEQRGGAYYSEVACNIISSIYNDKGDYQVVNTINNGSISSLDENCAIEVTSKITKEGPKPVVIGDLPLSIKGLVQHMKSFEQLVCDAVFEQNKSKALLALRVNPLTTSNTIAKKVFDELYDAHIDYVSYLK